MADPCGDDVLSAQLAAYKLQLAAYNTAILKVGVEGMSSYQLDTGQTRTLVTKHNLSTMRDTVGYLLEQITMLESMLCRSGSTHVVPGF